MSTKHLGAFALHTLPKIELHAHLSGSISRHCLHRIWLQKKSADSTLTLEDPLLAIPPGKVDYDLTTTENPALSILPSPTSENNIVQIINRGKYRFFPLFSSYIYKLCSDLESIRFSTLQVLADFEADNVVYLELRTTPRAIPHENISKQKYVETILSCINEYEEDPNHRLRTRLILSVDRRNTLDQANEVIDLCKAYKSQGVVGVDLCGDPARIPIDHLAPAFHDAHKSGLKITLHFAEAPISSSDKELWMLLSWQPDRIGHVINVHDDLRKEIVKRKIGVELCLSCNVHAKMITGSFGDHHFGWWKDNHIGVALCTDDVGVFCSPLSKEYALAAEHFSLSREDLVSLCESVVDITFADEEEKGRLRGLYKEVRKAIEAGKLD